jgi:hypothetical protein
MIDKIISIVSKDKTQWLIYSLTIALITLSWLPSDSNPLLIRISISMPTTTWVKLTITLLLATLGLIVSSLYTYVCKKRRHYRFDKTVGIFFHKKTGEPFCPSCLISNIESPLLEKDSGWTCQRKDCDMRYQNPKHQRSSTIKETPRGGY